MHAVSWVDDGSSLVTQSPPSLSPPRLNLGSVG